MRLKGFAGGEAGGEPRRAGDGLPSAGGAGVAPSRPEGKEAAGDDACASRR